LLINSDLSAVGIGGFGGGYMTIVNK